VLIVIAAYLLMMGPIPNDPSRDRATQGSEILHRNHRLRSWRGIDLDREWMHARSPHGLVLRSRFGMSSSSQTALRDVVHGLHHTASITTEHHGEGGLTQGSSCWSKVNPIPWTLTSPERAVRH